MVLIETNITYGQQYCNLVTGVFVGEGIALIWIGRLLIFALGFYAIKKIYDYFNNKRIARGY